MLRRNPGAPRLADRLSGSRAPGPASPWIRRGSRIGRCLPPECPCVGIGVVVPGELHDGARARPAPYGTETRSPGTSRRGGRSSGPALRGGSIGGVRGRAVGRDGRHGPASLERCWCRTTTRRMSPARRSRDVTIGVADPNVVGSHVNQLIRPTRIASSIRIEQPGHSERCEEIVLGNWLDAHEIDAGEDAVPPSKDIRHRIERCI